MTELQRLRAEFEFTYAEWANREIRNTECPWTFRRKEWTAYCTARDLYLEAVRQARLAEIH